MSKKKITYKKKKQVIYRQKPEMLLGELSGLKASSNQTWSQRSR